MEVKCPNCESGIFGLDIDTDTNAKHWQCQGCMKYVVDLSTQAKLNSAYEEQDFVSLQD